jgi:hypothetical protein
MVMATLAMKANISTEVMVSTSIADKMFTLKTIIQLGAAMKSPVTSSGSIFELLEKNHVSSMYHTLVCDFPNFHSMHEKGIFAC